MSRIIKSIGVTCIILVLVLAVTACGSKQVVEQPETVITEDGEEVVSDIPAMPSRTMPGKDGPVALDDEGEDF